MEPPRRKCRRARKKERRRRAPIHVTGHVHDRVFRDSAVRVAHCVAMRAFPDCRALNPGRRHTD